MYLSSGRQAIEAYEAALTVRTKEAFTHDWEQTQQNLEAARRELERLTLATRPS